ncbi:MAG: MFS transporter, partial [Planctomycetaceae bacterium]|nr:MFS transporter [Planctomycetaceae bacterium]
MTSNSDQDDEFSKKLPPLLADGSFWGLMATQFLGAFNDNLFKQLVLFVCVKQALDGQAGNLQGIAMFVFALPFVLLSGVCGVLADRYSKRSIIVVSKVLEIVAMLLGAVAFWTGSLLSLLVVLSLMGAHSAFFGPAKYGVLPELFRPQDLPRANGWMLMTLFLAIILGVALAGFLTVRLAGQLWLASTACIATAILGTLTAVVIRRTPAAHPGLPIHADSFGIPQEARQLLVSQPRFLAVLMATSVFWCVGGIYQQGVNDLGILQLGIDEQKTSLLGACAAIGIAMGCATAGKLSQGRFEARLV